MFYPYSKQFNTENSKKYLLEAVDSLHLQGDGIFTRKCVKLCQEILNQSSLFLTPSATASLEMTALLLNLQEGDEVIMPSYTFVSTASAFALRKAVPIFVDVSVDTLNIIPEEIEKAINNRTKAIVIVHYAGVACDMAKIMHIASKYNLPVIEDAAQAIGAYYLEKPLGTLGDFGCFSFHGTKNIVCGEGGLLTVNNNKYAKAAEIIREKGTDRQSFLRGEIDKYSWLTVGSSFLLSELNAAFLLGQLENLDVITKSRVQLWDSYYHIFNTSNYGEYFTIPEIPKYAMHNGHIFYVLLSKKLNREQVIKSMKAKNIQVTSHYVPLHTSQCGKAVGRSSGKLENTISVSESILRFPTWVGMSSEDLHFIKKSFEEAIDECK